MSVINDKEGSEYVSLLKELFHTEPKLYNYLLEVPPFRQVEFHERKYKGVKYLLVESIYPNNENKNYDAFILLEIPYVESVKNNRILDAFEISLFGRRIAKLSSKIAENLDYEVIEKKGVQIPSFRVLDSLEEVDELSKKLIDHYVKSVKNSRHKKFLEKASEIAKKEKMFEPILEREISV